VKVSETKSEVNSELTSLRRIVLLDLDVTLVNRDHKLTVSEDSVRSVIDRVQAKDTLVGLNSDTALLPLKLWAQRLGLKGPLLAEKGQVLAVSPAGEPLFDVGVRDYFHQLRQRVMLAALEEFTTAFVGVGDNTEFIREGRTYGVDRGAILINGHRRCSFSGYALGSQDNKLVNDSAIFNKFCDLVLAIIGNNLGRLEPPDRNPDYGILMLHDKGASKSIGVRRLMGMLGPDIEYVMIGDTDSDIIQSDYPIRLCAVGRASPALQEAVGRTGGVIASERFTKGVLEILTRLD
jgi:hydroxymethylpyrimidine pyrophosphatase-like HAD family hydrolase